MNYEKKSRLFKRLFCFTCDCPRAFCTKCNRFPIELIIILGHTIPLALYSCPEWFTVDKHLLVEFLDNVSPDIFNRWNIWELKHVFSVRMLTYSFCPANVITLHDLGINYREICVRANRAALNFRLIWFEFFLLSEVELFAIEVELEVRNCSETVAKLTRGWSRALLFIRFYFIYFGPDRLMPILKKIRLRLIFFRLRFASKIHWIYL